MCLFVFGFLVNPFYVLSILTLPKMRLPTRVFFGQCVIRRPLPVRGDAQYLKRNMEEKRGIADVHP